MAGVYFDVVNNLIDADENVLQSEANYAKVMGNRYKEMMTLYEQVGQLKTISGTDDNYQQIKTLKTQIRVTQKRLKDLGVSIDGVPIADMNMEELDIFLNDLQDQLSYNENKFQEEAQIDKGIAASLLILNKNRNKFLFRYNDPEVIKKYDREINEWAIEWFDTIGEYYLRENDDYQNMSDTQKMAVKSIGIEDIKKRGLRLESNDIANLGQVFRDKFNKTVDEVKQYTDEQQQEWAEKLKIIQDDILLGGTNLPKVYENTQDEIVTTEMKIIPLPELPQIPEIPNYIEYPQLLPPHGIGKQILQTADVIQQHTGLAEEYMAFRVPIGPDMEVITKCIPVQLPAQPVVYAGIQDNAVKPMIGRKLQGSMLGGVTEKLIAQGDKSEKQQDSASEQKLADKMSSLGEQLQSTSNFKQLARYMEINQKLRKTNSQLEEQAKKKTGSSQGQVVQRVNPLAEYMELVNHKKNMGEYDDDLLKYVNDLQYAYQNLAKTQKEKWALEEQIYQAKKAYRAQLINEVADSERFTQDAYQTMEGYKRLLSSGAGFTEKELKEIYYNMDQAQARAYAQYLQMAQGKYQKTGNERQYVNDLQWGLENRAYTEEQRWQYNREIEQSYLRQAKYAYERSGDERAYLRELDTRISDATLTEQERYQVLQECLGVYEKMTQEAKAQRDILKDSQTALIDFYKNELSVAVDPKKRSMAYDDLFVAANNTVAEAHTQQTESTRLANLYREELQNKFGIWDSDKFFNIRGEIVQSAVEQQLERLPEEQRARFQELIVELEKQKKEWYEMEQARLGAISTLQQAYGELQAQQQKAYNKVVDMIRKRKQQELEALEEVHKKRSEQLTDELKQAEKVYERQLNLLDDLKSNDDYQRRLQKETEIRDKLQQRIDLLALDDSDSARMQRLELEKQLREQEERIAEMQREHEYSEIRKALEEDWKKQQESIEKMQEDNDDRFEREQEKLDERYSEKNIANEANQVLATGQFTEFKEEAIHSYNDIYKHGVRVTQELTNAWKNYAVETGEYFNDLNRYEFTNLFHNLSLITDDMQKIGYWLEAFGYNPNVVFDKTGNGGDTSQTGMSYAHNYQLLLQDIKYRDDELSRAMDVIASRRDKGLSVADQKDYLKTIVDMMLTDFRTGAQGSHKYNKDTLDAVMRQYYYGINGGVEKEYGEAERLYSYLKNDAALRRERIEEIEAYGKIYGLSEGQRAYLDALKALGGTAGYSASGAVAAAYQDQAAAYQDQAAAYGQFAPTMNLTPVIQNTNTIGDVYINVEGSADAQTVQALQDAGGTILDQLGTELRGSGMRL
ncbi:MAG: hypothetical protein HFI90_11205 [Clostridia bacterium]|nr:hypothetical protein [Clostridia bacterium]